MAGYPYIQYGNLKIIGKPLEDLRLRRQPKAKLCPQPKVRQIRSTQGKGVGGWKDCTHLPLSVGRPYTAGYVDCA